MNNTSSDVDEIIENEVCNRLIRLSCAKMVNSKHERGGAKLHRNLLILHLLRRARNEQKRSLIFFSWKYSSFFLQRYFLFSIIGKFLGS